MCDMSVSTLEALSEGSCHCAIPIRYNRFPSWRCQSQFGTEHQANSLLSKSQSSESYRLVELGYKPTNGWSTYIPCQSTAHLLPDPFPILPLLCLISQGTTFPRLPCPPVSSWVWSIRVTRRRLEGRRKEVRMCYSPQFLLIVASLAAEILQFLSLWQQLPLTVSTMVQAPPRWPQFLVSIKQPLPCVSWALEVVTASCCC